ncbi:MAG: hypothetical protein AAGC97_00280 [Planctomycetota bacterium]
MKILALIQTLYLKGFASIWRLGRIVDAVPVRRRKVHLGEELVNL